MLEMVFVLPVLLLLVFAIAEFGLMFQRWLTLSNAVREGARVAVVYRETCNSTTVTSEVQTAVTNYATAGGIPSSQLTFNTFTGICSGTGNTATVNASYDYTFQLVPGMTAISSGGGTGGSMAPTITLKYASAMRNE